MPHRTSSFRRVITAVVTAGALLGSLVAVPPGVANANGQGPGVLPPVPDNGNQYPFVCTVYRELGVQPAVDNQDGQGVPVIDEQKVPDWEDRIWDHFPWRDDENLVAPGDLDRVRDITPVSDDELAGWSRDCELDEPIVEYRYLRTGGDDPTTPWVTEGQWVAFDNTGPLPDDITFINVEGEDEPVPYIVRWERGTVNRFIYSLAALAPHGESPTDAPDASLWNGRLVYHFGGGVGIGRSQGRVNVNNALYRQELQRGKAIVYSTGTVTSHHYNLLLGGRTAVQTKERFVEVYGEPVYTVGVGGSGGGIQQYVYAQNHPGLLDGGVPQYSYPDMVTQTIHIGDCELLEHYFEKTDKANPRWRKVENRIPVIGLNAESETANLSTGTVTQWGGLYGVLGLLGYSPPQPQSGRALTECRAAWSGLTPSAMNPTFQTVSGIGRLEGFDLSKVEFTHWDDAGEAYGYDDEGWARVPWGNEGIQYGLRAVAEGRLTPAEFLRLNALVGSWKDTGDQQLEGVPWSLATTPGINVTDEIGGLLGEAASNPEDVKAVFDPWSSRNMNLSPDGVTPAPRRSADPVAVQNAIDSGQVFNGLDAAGDPVDFPFIDWRHYLEHELDMHNTHQSFAARQRIIDAQGNYDNHLVWFTDARPREAWDQTPEALDVLEDWILAIRANPDKTAGQVRLELENPLATDACFDTNGVKIAAGHDVFDGIIDDKAPGECTDTFEIYSSSRIEAGAPINGDSFSCDLIDVDDAIADGYYGAWTPTQAQTARLKEIFPDGVCGFGSFHAPGNAPALPEPGFTDTRAGAYYTEALRWATAYGVTTGVRPGEFSPGGNVTRAQMAAFMWRAVGEPRPTDTSATPVFPDVPVGSFFDNAVRWLAENDLTTGQGTSGLYGSGGTLTRAQVAAFLWRLAGEPTVDIDQPFVDVAEGTFFDMATRWLFAEEITTGVGGSDRFAPSQSIPRAQLVALLYRMWEAGLIN